MNVASKHVLLITSTNLACNPRCLKEVRLLDSMGANITVVGFNLHNWTDEKEVEINKELNQVDFHYLETTRHHFFSWIIASLIEKISRTLAPYFKTNIFLQAMSNSKRSWTLLQWTKKWKGKPDLIIAHNSPAFYPAAMLAQSTNAALAIDVEDYHPAEVNDSNQKKSIEFLMKELIPKTSYTSFASPLIKKYTEDLLIGGDKFNGIVINNVFPVSEFLEPSQQIVAEKKMRFVWFSQYIDYGRGLEKIFSALDKFSDSIDLTLIGNLRKSFFENELKNRKYIHHLPSISQKELNNELCKYDVGLALEDVDADMNRNICLTNKIWSYFQAGLLIIASDTAAQHEFVTSHPGHAVMISFNPEEISNTIKKLIDQLEIIRSKKALRFEEAKKGCWENESKILVNEWEKLLLKTKE